MSLNHNMKQAFSHETKRINASSPSIAMFYLINSNASEEEMRNFAETNKIDYQIVKF